jgi:hypothetical protein
MMKGMRLRGEKRKIRDGSSFLISPSAYYIQYIDMWSANKGNKLRDSRLPCMPISLPCMLICLPISLPCMPISLPCIPNCMPCIPICMPSFLIRALPISLPVVAAPERVVDAGNAGPT